MKTIRTMMAGLSKACRAARQAFDRLMLGWQARTEQDGGLLRGWR